MDNFRQIPIDQIELNAGQIPGLPENPRIATPESIAKTADSIRQDLEMLNLRGLLVYPYGGKFIAIGGNSRLQALRQLQYADVPCVVIPESTPVEALKRYIVKDNASFGEWDFEKLAANWAVEDLESWSVELPPFEDSEAKKRTGWHQGKDNAGESLCDLKECVTWHLKGEISFISIYKKSEDGFPLPLIKSQDTNVPLFANAASSLIQHLIGLKSKDDWCIITTPKRRHLERNFASMVAEAIAKALEIPFYDNVVSAKTRKRVNPTFTVEKPFQEKNVIVFDDIITTGSTITAMGKCFPDKNCIYIIGINNN